MAKQVVVKNNHLKYGGTAYFRGRAEEVHLGSYGEKRTPITKMNYLEVKGKIRVPKSNIALATIVDIDFTKTSKSAFHTAVSVIVQGVPVNISGILALKWLKKGRLKLVKFSVTNNGMKKAANRSTQALKDLVYYGKNARIAHEVFVVMEASLAEKFNHNVSVDFSVRKWGVKAIVGGKSSSQGRTSVNISDGTTFAYLLLSIDWNAKKKKNKTKIMDLNDDQWGSN
ncbi:MAG: hypothetical protein COA61_008050 [Zetaproteobacteria bacterium]|nr:hypothetical protein [Zetaproteobacteria bacterium]